MGTGKRTENHSPSGFFVYIGMLNLIFYPMIAKPHGMKSSLILKNIGLMVFINNYTVNFIDEISKYEWEVGIN
jgi:hypothetical protein